MKIVQINAVYGTLSTGKIMQDIHRALLNDGNDSYAFWGTLCKNTDSDKNVIRIGNTLDHKIHALLYRLDKKQGWHSKIATYILCKKLKKIGPDVVHLHNLHSNYISLPILLRFLSENHIPTLLTLHDCWFFTGYCMHYLNFGCSNWKNSCDNCVACKRNSSLAYRLLKTKKELFESLPKLAFNGVSQWTAEAAGKSILSCAAEKRFIYNWIDTETFHPFNNKCEIFDKYGIDKTKKLILGVSQGWSENKGLKEFIEISKRFKDKADVILVGDSSNIPADSGIKAIGFTDSADELAQLYSAADVFVNPSRMETFGLVTAEALSCGTPVVAYANTGSLEIVSHDCGWLAEDGKSDDLINKIDIALKCSKSDFIQNCRSKALRLFNKEDRIAEYLELYKYIISK